MDPAKNSGDGGVVLDEREEFEAWLKKRGVSAWKREGQYVESMTRLWWECWQARALLAQPQKEVGQGDGGPAFPETITISPAGDVHRGFGGMSLRDYVAIEVLKGVIAKDGARHYIEVQEQQIEFAFAMADKFIRMR